MSSLTWAPSTSAPDGSAPTRISGRLVGRSFSLLGVSRLPMLRRCSPSPRLKPPPSAPRSNGTASSLRRSSCAGCSRASPTTPRHGSARALPLWQLQRDGHREAWRINGSRILRRAKSRSIGKSVSGLWFRWTEIGHTHLGMRRRIRVRRRPGVPIRHRS